jgi:hypothetical protein
VSSKVNVEVGLVSYTSQPVLNRNTSQERQKEENERDRNVKKQVPEYAPVSRRLRNKLLGTKQINMQILN